MIEIDKNPRFKTADGQLFATLEESQIHAIALILSGGISSLANTDIATEIIDNSSAIISILKMKSRKQKAKSKPKSAPKAATVAK